eukprot:CAMPEP_0206136570 /NCGR_PEP_ID=MMETSP1473-20131121/1806_1 /ASSEMBLY_ACC=CAM_ASM_001109 /TAXON_ID=1461547 /ORGANISM="Stichococcus sp, Strain RCC1054" /LENGTH=40 /DNA_ID= /DNA_START= /DNA_END= /DNA_ORIENTATION=
MMPPAHSIAGKAAALMVAAFVAVLLLFRRAPGRAMASAGS